MKVLLDTDIGTDVDDAVCLAYLLAQPECELLGITTVTGEAHRRAALASVLCKAAGREVPIYPGAETPLQGEQRQPRAQQAAALPRWPHESEFPQGQAVDFMGGTIRAHPGQVILLAVGPYTNLAQLFIKDPEIPALLRALVLMGGIFSQKPFLEPGRTEWNVSGDPAATRIVFAARPPVHRSLGLDVTQQVMMGAEEVRRRFSTPLLRPVLDFAEIWFSEFFPSITFHDPLAAAAIFDESLCTFASGTITLDDAPEASGTLPARTAFQPGGPDSPHHVAVTVDPGRYFEHFFRVVGAEG